jgi:hypothetical protein
MSTLIGAGWFDRFDLPRELRRAERGRVARLIRSPMAQGERWLGSILLGQVRHAQITSARVATG